MEVAETTPGEVVVDVEEVVIVIGISVLVAEGVGELGVVSFSAVWLTIVTQARQERRW